ncbi:hypothetical protein GCM10009117_09830 [Gangjinia marincola]|uniref:TonB-dependent receptor n=1 Tax=Gangjinia marincola TaxID=578463 RepID=A0ABN1MFB9_9FLAO
MNKIVWCLCAILCFNAQVWSQETAQKVELEEILARISTQHKVSFNYQSGILDDIQLSPPPTEFSLTLQLAYLEERTPLKFTRIDASIIAITKTMQICGYVMDPGSNAPLEGVTIVTTNASTLSDASGYFKLAVSDPTTRVTLSHLGYGVMEREAGSFDTKDCGPVLMIPQREELRSIQIDAYLVKGIAKASDRTTLIDYDQFSLLPGMIEADVLHTVQALPGISSLDETVSNITMRGGSNDQNLILWDDIKMYQTGHFFGLISAFNPHITQKAQVIHNGTDAALTDGVSGTIHMKTDQTITTKFKGIAGLNLLNAEAFADIPLNARSSVQLASRRSLDEVYRTPTYTTYFDRITQTTEADLNEVEVTNSDQTFNFYDVGARWLYQITAKDKIRLNALVIDNELRFNETANVGQEQQTRESSIAQRSYAAGLNYTRDWNATHATRAHIYESDYILRAINADVLESQRFLQENRVSETRVKLEHRMTQHNWRTLLGYDFTETEIINLNDVDVPRFVRRDEEVLREHAGYAQVHYTNPNNTLFVRGGVRANYISTLDTVLLEPRLSTRVALGKHIELQALAEFKHQNTSQIINFQNDFLGIEKRRWQLSDNDSIPILTSKQASLGMIFQKKSWLLDLNGFYKEVDGITTQSQGFTTKYEFAREQGSQETYGVELLLRKKTGALSTWISYAYLDATYRFESLPEISFPSNFDVTHTLTVGSTYSTEKWDLSAGLNYRTGRPTSIPLAENSVQDNQIQYAEANQERQPDYLRVDASALYRFKLGNSLRAETGISAWNLTDRQNVINDYYRINAQNKPAQFSRYALGLTTNAVFRLIL